MKKIGRVISEGALIEKAFDHLLAKTRYRNKSLNRIRFVIEDKRKLYLFKKLKKKFFDPYICEFEESIKREEAKKEKGNTIWFCWLQGLESAPDIVKCSYNSIQKNLCSNGEYMIQVVTEENFKEFVTLPDNIMGKYRKGIIGRAHFADILRLKLLIEYGGVWIDSTVVFNGTEIFDIVKDSELVMPNRFSWHAGRIMLVDNWFILSKSNNKILRLVYDLLLRYWEKYDYAIDYFFAHIFFAIAFDHYPDVLKKMPYLCAHSCEYLGTILFEEYDETIFNAVAAQTDLFKLHFKFSKSLADKENTYYRKILEKYLKI